MYFVELSELAKKQLNKLENEIQDRIIEKLKIVRIRPQAHVKKVVGNPHHTLRVGDYRVIMNIDKGKLIILVIEIGHRKNIYKQ